VIEFDANKSNLGQYKIAQSGEKSSSNVDFGQAPEVKMQVNIPLPVTQPGTQSVAKTADGKSLPDWLVFDGVTGKLSGVPPEGFKGMTVIISVPQANGEVQKIPVTINAKGG